MIRGPIGNGKSGGAVEVEMRRNFDELVGGHRCALACRIEIRITEDGITRLEAGYSRSDAFDHTGKFTAGRKWKRRLGLVLARDHQGVEEVEPCGRDPGHHLAGPCGRVGNIGDNEVLGCAEALTEKGFHGRPHTNAVGVPINAQRLLPPARPECEFP
jgi:hypothetical protein